MLDGDKLVKMRLMEGLNCGIDGQTKDLRFIDINSLLC